MTDNVAVTSALAYYARHGCALFPIPYGSKNPTGIISSFAHDYSTDPAQWDRWHAEHRCNFGLISGPSRVIIADVDVSEVGRDRAWAIWADWWQSRGLAVPAPHVQSARGGWHTLLALPADMDIATLRQVALIGPTDGSSKPIVDLRVGNGFVVAAGSYYDGTARNEQSGPYILLTDAAPYLAPDALIEHCRRVEAPTESVSRVGTRDRGDVAALMNWLTERGAFDDYEAWLAAGMACKLEYGDDGLDIWAITHNETVTPDVVVSKWNSFASDPKPGIQTLASLLAKAHAMGWKGTVRKSASAMFDGVAQIAAAAGANLHSQLPTGGAVGGLPMMAGQEELARLGLPFLDEFLSATADVPKPIADDYPTLPDTMSGHGLYDAMRQCIERITSLSEPPHKWKGKRTIAPLGVLRVMHADIYDAIDRRLTAMGHTVPRREIKLFAENLSEKVERVTVTHDKWEYDARTGLPESDNSDNVAVLLGILGLEIRWNAWLESMEIRGGSDNDLRWSDWTYVDDGIIARLRTRANRTKTRFRPGKDFLWESLLALAHANTVDPALETLTRLQSEWDGVPRLSIWLSRTCGVPCDPYYQSVGRNIVGGMVRRVRNPGCKHDTMVVFFGFQGSGKSTLAAVIADAGQTPLADINLGNGKFFTDTVRLGDEAKELVLSLAGKMIAEIGEMGTRGGANANHVKAMISRQVDEGRTAYSRAISRRQRRNVFIGTTNEDEPLQDPTGNRRFLPVKIEREIDLIWLHENIAQIVGEAAALEAKGEDFAIPRDVWSLAAKHQEAARSVSDIETQFTEWFSETEFTKAAFVTTSDLSFLTEALGWRRIEGLRNVIMKRLGFREFNTEIDGRKSRGWLRGPDIPPKMIAGLPRYMVSKSTSDGRPRVTIRTASVGIPGVPV